MNHSKRSRSGALPLILGAGVTLLILETYSAVLPTLAGEGLRGAPPTRGDATVGGGGAGPSYSLEFGTVSYGGDAPDNGTILIAGRDVVGIMSNQDYTIEVGPVPVLLAGSTGDGDGDDDGDVDVFDFEAFLACFSGPGVAYDPPTCWVFDMDRDGDVDRFDFALFQAAFTGSV